jgi:hypothetical protein
LQWFLLPYFHIAVCMLPCLWQTLPWTSLYLSLNHQYISTIGIFTIKYLLFHVQKYFNTPCLWNTLPWTSSHLSLNHQYISTRGIFTIKYLCFHAQKYFNNPVGNFFLPYAIYQKNFHSTCLWVFRIFYFNSTKACFILINFCEMIHPIAFSLSSVTFQRCIFCMSAFIQKYLSIP